MSDDHSVHPLDWASLETTNRNGWINNYLGQAPTLTPLQMSFLRGLEYLATKRVSGRPARDKLHHNGEDSESSTGDKLPTTAMKLAKVRGVSKNTIEREGKLAAGLLKLSADLRQQVLIGSVKVRKGELEALAGQPVPQGSVVSLSDFRPAATPSQTPLNPSSSDDQQDSELSLPAVSGAPEAGQGSLLMTTIRYHLDQIAMLEVGHPDGVAHLRDIDQAIWDLRAHWYSARPKPPSLLSQFFY